MNTAAAAVRERPVPRWRWATWWAALGGGVLIFYVLLTPIWIGLRLAAWAAELRARGRRPS